jgi:hypothetical protein
MQQFTTTAFHHGRHMCSSQKLNYLGRWLCAASTVVWVPAKADEAIAARIQGAMRRVDGVVRLLSRTSKISLRT